MKANKTKPLMGPGLSPLIAAVVATLLISVTSAQGQALAEENAWVLHERTLSLLEKRDAKSMALGGTSAGGGLVLASIHKLIGLGIAVPGALFAGTPWAIWPKRGTATSRTKALTTSS